MRGYPTPRGDTTAAFRARATRAGRARARRRAPAAVRALSSVERTRARRSRERTSRRRRRCAAPGARAGRVPVPARPPRTSTRAARCLKRSVALRTPFSGSGAPEARASSTGRGVDGHLSGARTARPSAATGRPRPRFAGRRHQPATARNALALRLVAAGRRRRGLRHEKSATATTAAAARRRRRPPGRRRAAAPSQYTTRRPSTRSSARRRAARARRRQGRPRRALHANGAWRARAARAREKRERVPRPRGARRVGVLPAGPPRRARARAGGARRRPRCPSADRDAPRRAARIGRAAVVFGGFSPEAPRWRLEASGAKALTACDGVMRGAKVRAQRETESHAVPSSPPESSPPRCRGARARAIGAREKRVALYRRRARSSSPRASPAAPSQRRARARARGARRRRRPAARRARRRRRRVVRSARAPRAARAARRGDVGRRARATPRSGKTKLRPATSSYLLSLTPFPRARRWHAATAAVAPADADGESGGPVGRRGAPAVRAVHSGSTGKPKGVLHTTGGYMISAATTFKYVFDVHSRERGDVFFCTADCGWITGHSCVSRAPAARAPRAAALLFLARILRV